MRPVDICFDNPQIIVNSLWINIIFMIIHNSQFYLPMRQNHLNVLMIQVFIALAIVFPSACDYGSVRVWLWCGVHVCHALVNSTVTRRFYTTLRGNSLIF